MTKKQDEVLSLESLVKTADNAIVATDADGHGLSTLRTAQRNVINTTPPGQGTVVNGETQAREFQQYGFLMNLQPGNSVNFDVSIVEGRFVTVSHQSGAGATGSVEVMGQAYNGPALRNGNVFAQSHTVGPSDTNRIILGEYIFMFAGPGTPDRDVLVLNGVHLDVANIQVEYEHDHYFEIYHVSGNIFRVHAFQWTKDDFMFATLSLGNATAKIGVRVGK